MWAPLCTIRACNTMRNARQKLQVLLPWYLDVAPEVVLCDSCGYPCGSATETALATLLAQPLRSYASFARPCASPFSPPLLSRRWVSQLPLSNLRHCLPTQGNILVVSTNGTLAVLNEFGSTSRAAPVQSFPIPGCFLAAVANEVYGSVSLNGYYALFPCGSTVSSTRYIARVSALGVVDTRCVH